jgi:hypothetical protein
MTDKAAKRVDDLQAKYETALQAHWDDPTDEAKHQASVKAAERLANARRDHRGEQIERGERSEGMGIIAEQNPEG